MLQPITLDNMCSKSKTKGNIQVEFYPNQFQRLCVQAVICECRYEGKGISDETYSAINMNIEAFNKNQLLFIKGELQFKKRKFLCDRLYDAVVARLNIL